MFLSPEIMRLKIVLYVICTKQVFTHISKDLILIPIICKFRKDIFSSYLTYMNTNSEAPNHF